MKSVGEVMGIGRSFQEALHKATQSLEIKRNGLGLTEKDIPIMIKLYLNLHTPVGIEYLLFTMQFKWEFR